MAIFKPKELHEFLASHGVHAKKSLSQNFLIDGNILNKIVTAADIKENDLVYEIGPGPGALTEKLLEAKARVIAIEMDRTLAKTLNRGQENLTVIEADCLKFNWESLSEKAKVVANLPYKITTPILARLLPLYDKITTITVMVQKEVALRFIAKKDTKDYSSFTIFLQFFADAEYCFTISPNCFYPKPKISSALVKLTLKKPPNIPHPEKFFQFVRTAFQQRRKMLRASLKKDYPHLNLGPFETARPEQLSLQDFLNLYATIKS